MESPQPTSAPPVVAPASEPAVSAIPDPHPPRTGASVDGTADSKFAAIDKTVLELRERVLTIREKDLLELRETVSALRANFKIALSIGSVVVAIAAGFGIKQYSDLDKTLSEALKTKIDRSLGYYEQFAKAIALANANAYAAALPILAELHAERPDDELVFSNYVNCFAETERFDEGYDVYKKLVDGGTFPKKFKLVHSYNNPGYIALIKSFTNSEFEATAHGLLTRAESIASADNSFDLKYPIWNLSIYYLSKGDLRRAASYARKFRELDPSAHWWHDQMERAWFQRLVKKRPDAKAQLERLYPRPAK